MNLPGLTKSAIIIVLSILLVGCSGLHNSLIEPSRGPKGECRFMINNEYDEDIAVKFYDVNDMQNHVHYLYVAAGRSGRVSKMAPGNYVIRYSKGKDWDPLKKQFTLNRKNYETDQKFTLEMKTYTQETAAGPQEVRQPTYMEFTIGSGSEEGTITTQEISDDEFSK